MTRRAGEPLVAVLEKRGRFTVAEPLFDRGRRITLDGSSRRAGNAGETFVMLSDLLPNAVPVKSAKAVLTVENHHKVESPEDIVITLTYTGPGLYPED